MKTSARRRATAQATAMGHKYPDKSSGFLRPRRFIAKQATQCEQRGAGLRIGQLKTGRLYEDRNSWGSLIPHPGPFPFEGTGGYGFDKSRLFKHMPPRRLRHPHRALAIDACRVLMD